MTSIYQHKTGGWYIQCMLEGGKRIQIYIGKLTKAQAAKAKEYVEQLRASARMNLEADKNAVHWALGTSEAIQKQLRQAGFLRVTVNQSYTAEEWMSHFIEATPMAASTVKKWKGLKKHMQEHFGHKPIAEITAGDCVRFKNKLVAAGNAPSHWGKMIQRSKQAFDLAVKDNLLTSNPFDDIKTSSKIDKKREAYVSPELFDRVIENAPHQEGRALFAMARYGGLRVPSEPLSLLWTDIDWELGRIKIGDETKTGSRVLPIFAGPLYIELRALFELQGDTKYVFPRARASAGTSYREWLESAILASRSRKWPKIWQNLRASCRTDLEERFPSHVCDAWLGHGRKVAKDHYLRVKPEHWAKAAETKRTVNDQAHSNAHSKE